MNIKEQLEKYRWINMSKSCHEDDYIDGFNDCLELLFPLVDVCEGLVEAFNGAITREIDGCFRIDSHSVKDIKKALENYEAWKRE